MVKDANVSGGPGGLENGGWVGVWGLGGAHPSEELLVMEAASDSDHQHPKQWTINIPRQVVTHTGTRGGCLATGIACMCACVRVCVCASHCSKANTHHERLLNENSDLLYVKALMSYSLHKKKK